MLWTLLLVASVVFSVSVRPIKAVQSKDGSGFDPEVNENMEDDEEWVLTDSEHSGGGGTGNLGRVVPLGPDSVNRRKPPSAVEHEDPVEEEEEEDLSAGGKNGGAGIVFENEDETKPEDPDNIFGEPVPVKENSLITHPGILAAIIVGGVLFLVCLIVFFVLIICCIRKKDEGMYDLDKAMQEKLKFIAYTKADTSEKEFFA